MTAGRIVDAFGEATFAIIDDEPGRLREVPGVGPIRASRIAAAWEEQRHIREVMATLQGFGISTSLAVRIYKRFREESAAVIIHEPFRLAREVWGIGFKTADKIAQAVGIAADAPARLQAGVLHALGEAAEQGHTLLPEETLCREAAKLLGTEAGGATPERTHVPSAESRHLLVSVTVLMRPRSRFGNSFCEADRLVDHQVKKPYARRWMVLVA